MNLPAGVRYQASDIDTRLIALLGDFFAVHVPGATASTHDLLATTMPLQADLVFLMKALTTLEQQEHGSGRRVLERIHARAIVASFPTRTLGGRNVGMRETYRSTWTPIMMDLGWKIRELDDPGELVLVLSREESATQGGGGGAGAPPDFPLDQDR
jgi:16S rRNA (guanine(1405)-N(7))-methyltransferase